jgi:uncharacterized membrane protein SirB2
MNVYAVAKAIHVTCVALSIAGFVTRFSVAARRPEVLRHTLVRVLPHVNDTVLLAAAITMLVVAQWNVLEMPWLAAKIAGLTAYIALGMVALKHGRTGGIRAAAFVGALIAFAYVVSVALSKSPAGPFAGVLA